MNETWILNATVLTMTGDKSPLENTSIGIKDSKVFFIGAKEDAKPSKGAKIIDGEKTLVLPGFINGHTHVGMTLLRGIADDEPLEKWLHETIFPLERKWGKEDFIEASSRLAFLEMIKTGTILCNDMYYLEEVAAKVAHEAGIRFIAGQTLVEISAVETGFSDFISRFDTFLKDIKKYPNVIPAMTPHSIYGVKIPTWKKIIEYAKSKNILLHFHLSETQEEVENCIKEHGKTPVEVFTDLGLWDCQVIAAHTVCVNDSEIATLGKHKVSVAHNPESNLKLGTKIAPLYQLRKAGCPILMGTDSAASNNNLDLLSEAATAAKLQSHKYGPGKMKAQDFVEILTCEGAQALGISHITGTIEVGKSADMIAIDTNSPQATPLYNPYSQLIYSLTGNDVKHTIVAGRVLMENRKVTTLNEEQILENSHQWAKKILGN